MDKRASDQVKLQSYCSKSLRANSKPPETIIEGILWKEDCAMLLGSEKAGKSICGKQIFVSIVTGKAFLGKHEVMKQGPVVYIQAEGKRDEFVERLNNMCMSIEGFNDDLFLHIFKKYCPLNTPVFKQAVFEAIDAQVKIWGCNPVAICIDSVYKAMEGDLNENQDIISFTNTIDEFISRYQSAILLIHHDAKEWRDDKRQTIDRGDKGAYGSVFLRAYVDHILYLKSHKDKSRTLTCDTTRSSKTSAESTTLVLVEPKPLCFQIKGDYRASTEMIIHQLKLNQKMTYRQITDATGLATITIKQGMNILIKDKKVDYFDTHQEREFFLKS